MKKQLLFIPLLAGFFMSAKADITVHDVAGTYVGKLEVFFENRAEDPVTYEFVSSKENVNVITEADNDKLIFLLKDFAIDLSEDPSSPLVMEVGDIRVENVEIDNLGNITSASTVIDKSDNFMLGKLPTTIMGTLLPTTAELGIRVLWDILEDMPTEESSTVQPIMVMYNGTKAVAASINKIEENLDITVSGNVIAVTGADVTAYSIYNVQGKQVAASSNVTGNVVDFSSLSDGVYIVKIDTDNKNALVKKIIKK